MNTQNVIAALAAAGFSHDVPADEEVARMWRGDDLGIAVDADEVVQLDEEGCPVRRWDDADSFLYDLSMGLVEPYGDESNAQSYTI